MMKYLLISMCSCVMSICTTAQTPARYRDATLPINVRVHDLLQRMTPEEKFWQLFMIPGDLGDNPHQYRNGIFGFQVNTVQQQQGAAAQIMNYLPGQNAGRTREKINAIQKYFVEQTRLGIPIIAFDEALHGLVREGATAFPQAIALAATFDTALMRKVALSIVSETKTRGIRHILSPVLNLATDVRWGRVEETYGEDPLLTTWMGLSFIKTFEDNGVITTPKHFVVNHGDGGRDSYPVHFNERFLEESYLVPFKAVVQRAGARSLMTAYNSVDGSPASANNWLLNKKLRKDWGFRGFVLSDAGATGGANVLHFTASDYADAGKKSVSNGQDVIFQTAYEHYSLFQKPYLDGSIPQAVIDSAVARVLRVKFELGLFERPYMEDPELTPAQMQKHREIAQEAASRGMVLLKNKNARLPLSSTTTKRIALIGTDAIEARLGGYSGPGNKPVSIHDGLKQLKTFDINFAAGPGRHTQEWVTIPGNQLTTPDGKPGLRGEYFNNATLEGTPALTRIDPAIQFQWTLFSPDPEKINYDFFSARWTGTLQSNVEGSHRIGVQGNDGYRLFIDDKLVIDNWVKQSFGTRHTPIVFTKGKQYRIRLEYFEPAGNARLRLVWDAGVTDSSALQIKAAVKLASTSDVSIITAGIEEGEFNDRALLSLPGQQEQLILDVAATGKPVIVVLIGGSAIRMDKWIDKVDAVIQAWYPGEAGGLALADILSGKVNPSGRLPITFPLTEGQLPLYYWHKPTGRGDDYTDLTGMPLFPFGFGLSYTTFRYAGLRLSTNKIRSTDTLSVIFTLKNTGTRAGEEVVQLYLRDELASVSRPVKEMKAFQRVHLKAGEEKPVTFKITPDMLEMLDINMQKTIEPGMFRLMIGASSADIRLRQQFEVIK